MKSRIAKLEEKVIDKSRKSTIKCAFSVYLSIVVAVAMSIILVVTASYFSPNSKLMSFMPALAGLSWIIAIFSVHRSGDKANVQIHLPFFWWWN